MSIFNKKKRLGNNDGRVNLVVKNKPSSMIAEQFRTVQTNIFFANTNNNLRSIMITSDRSARGKTTVSSNLAITFAQQGKKVILLDADMRRPMAHKVFNLNNDRGISTALSGMSMINDTIQHTNVNNLLVMPCGPIPPNPSELLNGEKFAKILDKLYTQCDLVIVDTPPVNVASDTSIMTTKVDGTVLVIPQGIAEKLEVSRAVNQLKKVHSNILGAIMNNVKDRKIDDYYYYK